MKHADIKTNSQLGYSFQMSAFDFPVFKNLI